MAYDKHIWTCGETITTEKLNHMEDGIAEAGSGGGTDYITMSWTSEDEPRCDIKGTFCGYEFESVFSLMRDADTEDVMAMLGEIVSNPEEENPLPAEMFEICSYVLLNKLWSMFGDGTKRIDYNNMSFGSTQTLYDAFNGFDKTFTVSL